MTKREKRGQSSVVIKECLKFQNVVNGTTGKVAGWGLTENMAYSPVLKEANLMSMDYRTCIDNNHMSFHPFVTPDKYCAFGLNESVCVVFGSFLWTF